MLFFFLSILLGVKALYLQTSVSHSVCVSTVFFIWFWFLFILIFTINFIFFSSTCKILDENNFLVGKSFFVGNFFLFGNFLGKKKISHQKNFHIKKKKNSDQTKSFFAFRRIFFFCLNFLIQVKLEAVFLLGLFFFCLQFFLGKKEISDQKQFHIKKKNLIFSPNKNWSSFSVFSIKSFMFFSSGIFFSWRNFISRENVDSRYFSDFSRLACDLGNVLNISVDVQIDHSRGIFCHVFHKCLLAD